MMKGSKYGAKATRTKIGFLVFIFDMMITILVGQRRSRDIGSISGVVPVFLKPLEEPQTAAVNRSYGKVGVFLHQHKPRGVSSIHYHQNRC